MDNADLSINANAIGDYHGLDAHKKALMGHNHSDLDSGFAENWSISQATASTSGLSSSSKYTSMSFKKSLDLETIAENNEVKGKNNSTIISMQINRMKFHKTS